jgi:glycosyltransferase involved in cell wall biosynthesis
MKLSIISSFTVIHDEGTLQTMKESLIIYHLVDRQKKKTTRNFTCPSFKQAVFLPMPKDSHCVSLIIPTIGRATIKQCLAALHQQTRPPDEIIVLKDAMRRGVAWARNEGIRQSHGDLIAFIDDDCFPPPDWLERLVNAMDKYDAAGAGGPFEETDPLLFHIRKRYPSSDQEQLDTEGFAGNGGNILFRRMWLEKLAAQDGFLFNRLVAMGENAVKGCFA